MANPFTQDGCQARFDWGLTGARTVGGTVGIVVVVDILSFTTTLTVAADEGIEVFPYRFGDASAASYARRHNAVLAVGRAQARQPGQVSLSPVTVRAATGLRRLVLPSPNGSTIAQSLAAAGSCVVAVSLRNLDAAVRWAAARMAAQATTSVAVIAAGERWSDGSLRPAVEDLWGAGGFLAGIADRGNMSLSPEAAAAAAAYRDVCRVLPARLRECASGRELRELGYPDDVKVAAELEASRAVPVLMGESFRNAGEL
jgi:2-phosphosulfolactate phosphatase